MITCQPLSLINMGSGKGYDLAFNNRSFNCLKPDILFKIFLKQSRLIHMLFEKSHTFVYHVT
jgi:hypothetical protein